MSEYVAYYRVSTKKQGESGLGLEAQHDIVHGIFKGVVAEYTDIQSGTSADNRPNLQAAIKHCIESGLTLVVAKVDRLARDVVDGLNIVEKLKGKVKFGDLPGDADRFTLTLYFAFAEREALLTQLRTKGALARAKANGKKLGNPRKFTKADIKASVESKRNESLNNENNIRAYNYINSLRMEGLSYKEVADRLNSAKFKTSTGAEWHAGSVYHVWRRHKYFGVPSEVTF